MATPASLPRVAKDGNLAKYVRAHGPLTAKNCIKGRVAEEAEDDEE